MIKNIIGFALGFILSSSAVAYAQSNLLSASLATSYQFCWDKPAPDLATANAYVYKYSVDGGAQTTFAAPCTGTTSPFICKATNSLPVVTNGNHPFTITANVILIDGSTLSSTVSATGNYIITGPPATPQNPRINKIGTLALAMLIDFLEPWL